jgi:membrane protease subunit HflC
VKRRGIFTMFVALILVATLVTFLVAFQVRVNERALVFTFGKVSRPITKPGLYLKWPYPIQTVRRFDTRVSVFEAKPQESYTDDGKNVTLAVTVGWSIDDPRRFYESLQTEGKAREQLESLVGSEANSAIGRHTFGQFVSTDEKKLAFDNIESEIQGAIATTAQERYGIRMHFVRITQLGLPEKVTERVFARMKAERERIAKKYRSEGKSEADKIRADADRQREVLLSNAEAQATRLRGQGEAAAAKAYQVFRKNEELAIFLRKLDAIRKLKERLTIVLDTRSPPWDLFQGEIGSVIDRAKAKAPKPAAANPKPRGN